jgi:hypothetical protein
MDLSNKKVDLILSQEIFKTLVKGEIINEKNYDGSTQSFIDNKYFTELRSQFDQYSLQYEMINMKLVDNLNYFYITEHSSSSGNAKQLAKTKIYAALTILIRYMMNENGKTFDNIKNINYGVKEEDFSEMDHDDYYSNILKIARIDNIKGVFKILNERNLLFKTKNNKYILSDSGKSIVQHINDKYK